MTLEEKSWAFGPFIRPDDVNPIIRPNPNSTFDCPMRKRKIRWEALHTFNPAAIVKDNKVYVLYRAEDDTGEMTIGHHTSRLGLAESIDGVHFTQLPAPIFYPAEDNQKQYEWDGGCEDPRIVETEDGLFILLYTEYNHKIPRLGVATSRDLLQWQKHGPALRCLGLQTPLNWWTKSASIVTTIKEGRLKAVKFDGKYRMYWGERWIKYTESKDGIRWNFGKKVMQTRKGYFDSQLTEAGPPAIMVKEGIVLIYNGKNHPTFGDPNYPQNVYTGGQVLFDTKHPWQIKDRLEQPFFKPEADFEKSGQYNAGTTFLEGLVYFHEKWFMYYGCADSFVGVAVWDPKKNNRP